MPPVVCPHCGTSNRAGSKFCNWCGTDLLSDEAPEQPRSTGQPESAGSSREQDSAGDLAAGQPQLEPDADEHDGMATDEEDPPLDGGDTGRDAGPERLITGIQGLLSPRNIAHLDQTSSADAMQAPQRSASDPGAEQVRHLRQIMSEEPGVVTDPALDPVPLRPSLRLPWVFWLVGLALGIPVLLAGVRPAGTPQRWPGIDAAYNLIQSRAPESTVLVSWAYDPATGGEMDLVAEPVIRHLLSRGSRLVVISQLPGGPATARRLIGRVQQELTPAQRSAIALEPAQSSQNLYLPGGATTLPLVGQAPTVVADMEAIGAAPGFAGAFSGPPDLALVIAAQAEDVQHWLEQVQPLNRVQVIALTSAGADPILRPYWDSGQLSGLVSGFDGAYSYEALLAGPEAAVDNPTLDLQILGQNWGHIMLLGLILLGNLATLLGLERRRRP